MSLKILIITASLVVLCLCQPEKKGCARPSIFKGPQDVKTYVECVKALTSPVVYGKRSVQPPSIILQKLTQDVANDYDEDCPRPSIFRRREEVLMYLDCLRTKRPIVFYGRKSVPTQSIHIQKPQDVVNDYNEDDDVLIHNLDGEPNYME